MQFSRTAWTLQTEVHVFDGQLMHTDCTNIILIPRTTKYFSNNGIENVKSNSVTYCWSVVVSGS